MTRSTVRTGESRIDRLSQRSRRLIVVAALVGLPAMYVWSGYWLTTSVSNLIWGPVSFLLIGATVVGSLILYRFVRDRADVRAGSLDERQQQLRDRALILSYGRSQYLSSTASESCASWSSSSGARSCSTATSWSRWRSASVS